MFEKMDKIPQMPSEKTAPSAAALTRGSTTHRLWTRAHTVNQPLARGVRFSHPSPDTLYTLVIYLDLATAHWMTFGASQTKGGVHALRPHCYEVLKKPNQNKLMISVCNQGEEDYC